MREVLVGGNVEMTDFIYEDAFDPDVNIKVIGVGGGGGNAPTAAPAAEPGGGTGTRLDTAAGPPAPGADFHHPWFLPNGAPGGLPGGGH